jgi:CspA family cold shock protein
LSFKSTKMNKGEIKFYDKTKGFGFITDQDTKEEIFVHATGLTEEVGQGDKVSFDTTQGKKGINAVKVKKL